jgi:hypothetical protein
MTAGCEINRASGKGHVAIISQEEGRNGQLGMGKRIIGVERNRSFELANRALDCDNRALSQ